MPYIPNTDDDRRIMLEKIGVKSFNDLLKPVPENVRLKEDLKLPEPLSEMELLREMKEMAGKNRSGMVVFAGGGVYDHFIPAALENLLSRPEFVTAYTPYQAEVAQGTLQVIYEFQTGICRLTGMDVANASMYDGGSAAAEAVALAISATNRERVVISDTVSPAYREVTATYMSGRNVEIVTVPNKGGVSDFDAVKKELNEKTAALVVSYPNFFGILEDIEAAAEMIHAVGGKLIVALDPVAAAILKTPGDLGADIVVGEGQPLGIPMNFGGPLLGFFAVKKELVRQLPGRLAGRTVDLDGKPGFVLTLQTREQHIRREKASSNICTNQALCATAATIYLSLMGKQGLKRVALLCLEKTHRAAEKIFALDGYEPLFKGNFVREFAVRTPIPAKDLIDRMIIEKNILPGVNLRRFYPDMSHGMLVSVTEKRTDKEINEFVTALKEYSSDKIVSRV